MTSQQIRKLYLDFFASRGHKILPSAPLVPENDPTTLFVSAGMQPMLPYILGKPHPLGKRIADIQKCLRMEDVDEVGDNRHQTFFEMMGNWSLGDYFKKEQLPWIFEFLTKEVGLDPNRFYVTVFNGDAKYHLPKDTQSVEIWKELFAKQGVNAKEVELESLENAAQVGMQGGRIFYYDQKKNWWTRSSSIEEMPKGEPGGPCSEMFYEFTEIEHDPKYGKYCHPNCDCGRFLEIGNSVFMQYQKQNDGSLKELPNKGVDFGGGAERAIMVANNQPDVFQTDLFLPIIQKLEELSGKKYAENLQAFRIIADHVKAATFVLTEGIEPSNVGRGYVLRRLIRRAIRYGKQLGIKDIFTSIIAEVVIDIYPELKKNKKFIQDHMINEEERFKKSLEEGLKKSQRIFDKKTSISGEKYSKIMQVLDKKEIFRAIYRGDADAILKFGIPIEIDEIRNATISGKEAFDLFQTYGFPIEMIIELAQEKNLLVDIENYREEAKKHQELSRTASAGMFKGGLTDHSEIVTKYHTATHLLQASLRQVLGEHVGQKGSNITAERLRFDFSHPEKLTPEQIKNVEDLVNQKIAENLPVTMETMTLDEAKEKGAMAVFTGKYGDKVKVYSIGPSRSSGRPFSVEVCGGPHVDFTGQLGKFKIIKEEAAGAGLRRIYGTVQCPD